jgi:hypothetical protein
MKKVREAIENLGYEELVNIQKDLFNGGTRMRQIVASKLKEIEEAETRICATCGNNININRTENFTLIFGPIDLKKKATFCALDCMEYFLTSLKQLSTKRNKASKAKI